MKYVVLFSGGHSSALVAIEAVRKHSKENVMLLNHNISSEVEHEDIKRFKQEVADYLGLEITYANMDGWETMTPLRVCKKIGAFKVGKGTELCTSKLKTEPFKKWLKEHEADKDNITLLYGFDEGEFARIERRRRIMGDMGWNIECPLAEWERTIEEIEEIGINRPITYERFRHANCIGCLKAGRQQWYIVYCLHPELWEEAKETEAYIGYSIIKGSFLKDLEPKFERMKQKGIVPTESIKAATFWASVERELKQPDQITLEDIIKR